MRIFVHFCQNTYFCFRFMCELFCWFYFKPPISFHRTGCYAPTHRFSIKLQYEVIYAKIWWKSSNLSQYRFSYDLLKNYAHYCKSVEENNVHSVIIKEVYSPCLDYSSSEVEDHRGGRQQQGYEEESRKMSSRTTVTRFRIMGKY